MAKAIMKVVMKLVSSVVDIVLLPVNALISTLFPNFSTGVTVFNNFINRYVGGTIGYFSNLLPHRFKVLFGLWLTFLISYYTIAWSYTLITKIYNVIRKIKFW